MVRRLTTYALLKRIHVASAFICGVFLLMYFLTGYLMGRPDWFDREEAESEKRMYALELPKNLSPEQLAHAVSDSLSLFGKLYFGSVHDNGSIAYDLIHPKKELRVYVNMPEQEVEVTENKVHLYGSLTIYHRLHQYSGQMLYSAYFFMMDLSSLALLIFVITGMLLWVKLLRNIWWGMAFLVAGIVFTTWVIWTFFIW